MDALVKGSRDTVTIGRFDYEDMIKAIGNGGNTLGGFVKALLEL